jgi:hypothetical protein
MASHPVHPDVNIRSYENLRVVKETTCFAEMWYHPPVYTDLTKQKKLIFIVIAVRISNPGINLVT